MSRRNLPRIDYKLLHNTGAISTHIEEDLAADLCNMSITQTPPTELEVDVMVIMDEVNDTIDENRDLSSHELDAALRKLAELRQQLRRKNLQLGTTKLPIQESLNKIKEFIVTAKDFKTKARIREDSIKADAAKRNKESIAFLIEHIQLQIDDLEEAFKRKVKSADAEELLRLRSDLPSQLKKFDKIADSYKEVLEHSSPSDELRIYKLKAIKDNYTKLSKLKKDYVKSLEEEIEQQEVDKARKFNQAQLNIKLESFSGYDCKTDFYTFKSNFEKVHLQTTPKRLLPDLLKNNFLLEPALTLVRSLDNIDTIWERLQEAYGDPKIMLSRKLRQLRQLDQVRTSNAERLTIELGQIINMMSEVTKLAKDHQIEEHLYYGDGFTKICHLLGDHRTTKFLTTVCEKDLSPKETWEELVAFLGKEKKVHQQRMRLNTLKMDTTQDERKSNSSTMKRSGAHATYPSITSDTNCHICGAAEGVSDHVATAGPGGTKILQYFTCMEFADKTPAARLALLKEKGYCFQCLYPGASSSTEKHSEGRCQRDFVCPHPSHSKYNVKKHVLVCEEHKTMDCNTQLLQRFVQRFIRSPGLPDFSRNISLSFHTACYKVDNDKCDRGIYLLQEILVNNKKLTIFFDNGCSDFVISKKAVQLLGSRAQQESSQPIMLSGVGNSITKSYGIYSVQLPLYNGNEISLSGVCLQQITATFPVYPLKAVEEDIQQCYSSSGGTSILPKLPGSVGGEVHMMIGIKYLRYHPKMMFQLPSGLAIYESVFVNSSGGRGVVGGPHRIFTEIHGRHTNVATTFFTRECEMLRNSIADVPLLGFNSSHPSTEIHFTDSSQPQLLAHLSNAMKVFEEVEATGSDICYRCPQCRTCKDCKHNNNELVSIKEEVEQSIINSSITIDPETKTVSATLPFMADPFTRLANNKDKAMKVYRQQLKKLNDPSNADDKQDILESEAKLQRLGYVDYVRNLPPETQMMLKNHRMQHFLPWRAVWKGNSVSTPCRVVYDASMSTSSGYSLNDLLAKGRNNLNKLQEIIIRWSIKLVAIHTDITKMYNTVQLKESEWCFQRYLWQEGLNLGVPPEEKIVKTLIYGVKSSGNQAENALRKVAEMLEDKFPKVKQIIHKDVYVDDVATGDESNEKAHHTADQLELVLNQGGFKLKGIAFSGEDPPDTLSDDGMTIHVGGMKWFPKSDMVSLNIGELNFAKKRRGKKPTASINIIPKKLTRRHCASKVAEVFDLVGKVSPLVASMKLDLQDLVQRQLDWDDIIPDTLRPLWESNFQMIQEISNLKYNRAVVPVDAVSMDVNTVDFGDASQSMVCVAIYARFLRRNGEYSCQLILSRTRVVPKGTSQPRSELYAALINTHTGEIVKRSLQKFHQSSIKLTDSQIALYWIDNEDKPLKQWLRNRVIEIRRFTEKHQWYHIGTDNMIADIGTRKGATIKDVDSTSTWINGYAWMKLPVEEFPIFSAEALRIDETETAEAHKEFQVQVHNSFLPHEVQKRYKFSKYLVDPNRRSFSSVVRILGYVIRFCNKLRKKNSTSTSQTLNDEEIHAAEMYFFRKATLEIVHFLPPKKYEPISTLKDDVLIYNGRILPESKITIIGRYTEAMLDLSSTTFCVPLIDKHSPIAYSLVLDVHWNSQSKHAGVETTLRQVMKKAFIIEGRSLVKSIKKSCKRCKYLNKRTVEAAMGPVPEASLTIAPAFYHTQLDLSGPYKAYSHLHKRTTIKIWLVVYCCCATSAMVINVMDDYSTTSFLLSFTRFAARHGFPKQVFCDEGGQLVKGTQDMRLNFNDIKSRLHQEKRVIVQTCPVGAHNVNGKVERKIKEVNSSLEKNLNNHRLSILQWETLAAVIANTINDLPIAIKSLIDVENMDLLTPNRLLLGRNNDRSPAGDMVVSADPCKLLKENSKVYEAWFESWLLNHVPKLMKQDKWFKHERNLQVGDVVLFTKVDSVLSKSYTYGMITDVKIGEDGRVRNVTVKYRNSNEKVSRETHRSVRNLILIHSVDECDFMAVLGEMAKNVDTNFQVQV